MITGTGKGYTVIVKVMAGPGQEIPPPVNVGVTVMVATTGSVPLLVAVNKILPVPDAPRPMTVVLLAQV